MRFYGTYYGMNHIQDYTHTLQSAWGQNAAGVGGPVPFHFSRLTTGFLLRISYPGHFQTGTEHVRGV